MSIYKSKHEYRKIYEQHYGPIPKDQDGRSYEIHHIDGDHNCDISNLKCVTIQEHYDIHYAQGDWAACLLMSDRMKISPVEKSYLAKLANTGENNPMYGTIWITNGIENKKIDGESVIPSGWTRGRSFNEDHSKAFTKRSKVGSNNSRYDPTLHRFKQLSTGEEVQMTKYNFSKTYNIHGKHIRDLMRMNRESFRGWIFVPD